MSEQAKILYIDKEVGSKFTVSDANSIKSVVNLHADSIDNVTGDVSDVASRLEALESAGGGGGGDNTLLTASLTTISGTVDTNALNISTITGQIDTISGTVDTNALNISTITGQIDTISGTVDTNALNISTITGDIDDVREIAVDANQFAADALITSTKNSISITAVSGRVDTLENNGGGGGSDNTELTNSLTTISGTVDTITGQIDTISGTVDNNALNISTITGQIDTISGTVDNNALNISTITGQIDTISGTVDTNALNISTITGQIDTISGTVDTNALNISTNSNNITIATDQTKIYNNINADDLNETFITLDLVHYDKFYITVAESDKWIDNSDATQPPLLKTKLLTNNDQTMYSFEVLFEYDSFSNPWVGQQLNKAARLTLDEPASYYNDMQDLETAFNSSSTAPIEKLYCTYHKGNTVSLNVSDLQFNNLTAVNPSQITQVTDISAMTMLNIPSEFVPVAGEGGTNILEWPNQIGIYKYYIQVTDVSTTPMWQLFRQDVDSAPPPGSPENLPEDLTSNFSENSDEYSITEDQTTLESTINIASPPNQLITQYHYIDPAVYGGHSSYTDEGPDR